MGEGKGEGKVGENSTHWTAREGWQASRPGGRSPSNEGSPRPTPAASRRSSPASRLAASRSGATGGSKGNHESAGRVERQARGRITSRGGTSRLPTKGRRDRRIRRGTTNTTPGLGEGHGPLRPSRDPALSLSLLSPSVKRGNPAAPHIILLPHLSLRQAHQAVNSSSLDAKACRGNMNTRECVHSDQKASGGCVSISPAALAGVSAGAARPQRGRLR